MAKKALNFAEAKNDFDKQQEASASVDKKAATKKPNTDFIRLDLKPFGYDLKDYVTSKAAALTIERGKRVTTTSFIQELIIADMEAQKSKGKPTKREKILSALENVDDKKLSAIATLLDISL